MKILVTGSIAYDLLLTYDGSFSDAIDPAHLDELSMAFVTPRFAKHHGGTAANIAWNLRFLNQMPLVVGTVGHDGGPYLSLLEERGIPVQRIETLREHATSTAIIGTDSRERQITFYHPGADAAGQWPEELDEDREDIAFAVVGPRDAKMMINAVDWCQKFRIPFLFDPGQQVMAFGEDDLLKAIRASRGVIANAYEWQLLSQRTGFSANAILKETHMLIITQAEDGLTIYSPKEEIVIPACRPDRVVNPTGAGDALRAGFLTGLAAGWDLRQCGQLGASMASFVVEQEGTLIGNLDAQDVFSRAQLTYGDVLPALS